MKRIISIIAAAAMALCLSSCNVKIENPTERNFVGTWDLESIEIIASDGTVTSTPAKTLDYWIVKDGVASIYTADRLDRQVKFSVKDNVIYFDGTIAYRIEEMSTREMTLSQNGFGILVSSYKYHYKKR